MESSTEPGTRLSWPAEVAIAALSGVVTAHLPIHRWSRGSRWALHGGIAAATAGWTALVMRSDHGGEGQSGPDVPEEPPSIRATTAVSLLAGATMLAASRGGEAADRWVEHRLAAHGVARPRLWIGVAAAGATLAMAAADRRTGPRRDRAQIVPGSEGGGGDPGTGG